MLKNLSDFISNHVVGFSILSLFVLIIICIIIFKIIVHCHYSRHKDFPYQNLEKRYYYSEDTTCLGSGANYHIPSTDKTSNEEIIKFIRINKEKENGVKK